MKHTTISGKRNTQWRKAGLSINIFLFVILLLPSVHAEVRLDVEKNKIVIRGGHESLATIIDAQNDNGLRNKFIRQDGNSCFLKTPVDIKIDATLSVLGSDCKTLHMYPDSVIKIQGSAFFKNVKVISADPKTNEPIELTRIYYDRKRPHIYTTDPAKYVHIENSEFSHLGYYNKQPGSKWGVSFWHLDSGYIGNSKFHDNYFGIYTWNTKNMTIENNEVYDNLEYGMDFHDFSDNFVVNNNVVYNNGNHGIIFSKWCDNNRIVNNLVFDHTKNAFVKGYEQKYGVHGIMLHLESNNNVVHGNVLRNNRVGIFVYKSENNTIRENIILDDLEEGIYIDRSNGNIIKNNVVFDTEGFSLYSHFSDENTYSDNYFQNRLLFKGEDSGEIYRIESSSKDFPPDLSEDVEKQILDRITESKETAEEPVAAPPPVTSRVLQEFESVEPIAVVEQIVEVAPSIPENEGLIFKMEAFFMSGGNLAVKMGIIVAIAIIAVTVIALEMIKRSSNGY